VFTLKAGKVVRWRMFADEAKALAAVGIREEPGSPVDRELRHDRRARARPATPRQPPARRSRPDRLARPGPSPGRAATPASSARSSPYVRGNGDGQRPLGPLPRKQGDPRGAAMSKTAQPPPMGRPGRSTCSGACRGTAGRGERDRLRHGGLRVALGQEGSLGVAVRLAVPRLAGQPHWPAASLIAYSGAWIRG
jgi:hypothetical protein